MMHQDKPHEFFFDFPFLGRSIAFHRRRVGLSRAELARQLAIPVKLFAAYEAGTARVRVDRLAEIENVLNVSIISQFTDQGK